MDQKIIKSIKLFIFIFLVLFLGAKFIGLKLKGQLNDYGPFTWKESFQNIPKCLLLS
jgi:hypothetical protein